MKGTNNNVPVTAIVMLLASSFFPHVNSFAPSFHVTFPSYARHTSHTKNFLFEKDSKNLLKLNLVIDPSAMVESGSALLETISSASASISHDSSSSLIAFSDQGQNLAGIFFQSSLLPYIIFLYFLGFRGNRTPPLGNFGFQFLLFFVLSTIPSGVVTKSTYGCSLADVDWLHGGAEALLTITNLLIVLGFRSASSQAEPLSPSKPRLIAFGAFAAFIVAMSLGPSLGVEAHSPFLLGLGNLPESWTASLPWVSFASLVR